MPNERLFQATDSIICLIEARKFQITYYQIVIFHIKWRSRIYYKGWFKANREDKAGLNK